jgi:hypothetical protein
LFFVFVVLFAFPYCAQAAPQRSPRSLAKFLFLFLFYLFCRLLGAGGLAALREVACGAACEEKIINFFF